MKTLKYNQVLLIVSAFFTVVSAKRTHEQSFITAMEFQFNGGFGFGFVHSYGLKIPCLQRETPLMKSNYCKLFIETKLIPINFESTIGLTFSPLVFLKFSTGTSIGTGWALKDVHGFALNSDTRENPQPLRGVLVKPFLSSAFQMETKAFTKKRWLNFQGFIAEKLVYAKNCAVSDNQSWIYENDRGENQNGWYALMNSYVGYDMPFSKSINGKLGMTLDIRVDISHRNESPMSSKNGWGSDFKRTLFGPIGIVEFSRGYSMIINLQWVKTKVYSDESENEVFYKNRIYKSAKYSLFRTLVVIKKVF